MSEDLTHKTDVQRRCFETVSEAYSSNCDWLVICSLTFLLAQEYFMSGDLSA